jgi:hypothetical protein
MRARILQRQQLEQVKIASFRITHYLLPTVKQVWQNDIAPLIVP